MSPIGKTPDRSFTGPRSDSYQYRIMERTFVETYFLSFDNSHSLSHHLNPFAYSEELLDLKDQLYNEIINIINNKLTPRQKQCMILYYVDGYTQFEISKMLKINQSSVVKSISGNEVKFDRSVRKTKSLDGKYGGAFKKIKKLVKDNPVIQQLLIDINELQSERF